MRPGHAPFLIVASVLWVAGCPVLAQDAPLAEQVQALATLFKLGLPEARGAKWVKAQVQDGSGGGILLPGGDEAGYSGNAWLLREEKNGTVELIMDHTRRVRARRAKGEEESAGSLPLVRIQPADLDADLKKLATALKPGGPKNGNSVRVGDDYIDSDEAPAAMAAGALLLCAHLQQQGRAAQVGTLLPAALAFAPEPADALDFALSLITDVRLRQLTDSFLEKRDAAAYAQGIEKLAGEFPRGWRKREAVLFLARRVREQKPAPQADDAGAKKAAALLLALKSDQLQSLPMNSNWLIPADGPGPDGRSGRRYRGRRMPVEDSEETAAPSGPMTAFFAERRTAFAAVARLLDDRRFVPLRRGEISGSGSSYVSSDAKPAERLRQQYNGLDRPVELREIAWALVSQILPDRLRSEIDDHETGRAEKVLAWFATVATLSDDALAWTAMRESNGAYDSDFGTALTFLVAKGNAESQKLLQEVFLDPAVWGSGRSDEMLGHLETYAGKLGPAATAFGEKVRPVVAAAIKARNAEQRANMAGNQSNAEQRKMMDEQLKMLERQAAGELKKFDQIFKPQGLPEMLAELADADKDSSTELWQTLQGELGKVPWPQAEALLFQTAPKAKDPAVRTGILTLLLQRGMGGGGGKKAPVSAPDVPTRAALETLLADASPLPEPIPWAPAAETVADFAALAFVLPRLPETDSPRWQAAMGKLPEFAIGWLKTHARALAAGQPAPPMPDAKRAPAGRAEAVVAEVAALPPEKILAALLAKTPDEQAAAAEQLGTLTDWPSALLNARLTVVGAQSDKSELAKSLNADRWKGRRFDETLRQEIATAVEKTGLDGRACMLGVAPVGLLGGVKIMVQSRGNGNLSAQDLARAKVPLLEGKPPPVAILASFFVVQSERRPPPVTFASVLWKDAELTRAWREKFARPADPAAKPESAESEDARFRQQGFPGKNNDPAPFDHAVRDLLAGKPAARGQFGLWWTARPVKESKDDDDN